MSAPSIETARRPVGRVPVLVVLALAVVAGLVARWHSLGQSLYGDELQSYWVVTRNTPFQLLDAVWSDAELTPPLFFVLSKLTTQLGQGFELLRAPSFVAGALTLPVIYALGLRTIGRRGAVVATCLAALSPFMIYYSTEARAYGVLMLLLSLGTLALLLAVDDGRRRWWVLFAVCTAGAMYAHYTGVFVLATQFAWALWFHSAHRRRIVLATGAAALVYVPWIPGALADFASPTQEILSALLPFTAPVVWDSVWHWMLGYPYPGLALRRLPGVPGLALLALSTLVGVLGVVLARRRGRPADDRGPTGGHRSSSADGSSHGSGPVPSGQVRRQRLLLLVLLAVATFVGEALLSALGNNLLSVRNLASSWPALVLVFSALLTAGPPRIALLAGALAIGGFAFGTAGMLRNETERPRYPEATRWIEKRIQAGDVVLDGTGLLNPGPLTGYDASEPRVADTVRVYVPEQREVPWRVLDRRIPEAEAAAAAVRTAAGGRVYVIGYEPLMPETLPGYRQVGGARWPGLTAVRVRVFAPPG